MALVIIYSDIFQWLVCHPHENMHYGVGGWSPLWWGAGEMGMVTRTHDRTKTHKHYVKSSASSDSAPSVRIHWLSYSFFCFIFSCPFPCLTFICLSESIFLSLFGKLTWAGSFQLQKEILFHDSNEANGGVCALPLICQSLFLRSE